MSVYRFKDVGGISNKKIYGSMAAGNPTGFAEATVWLVGGGGSAGGLGGGGGGGGVIPNQSAEFGRGFSYTIAIGASGSNVPANDLTTHGGKGGDTSLEYFSGGGTQTLTAIGGGGGIAYSTTTTPSSANGGSGGGGNQTIGRFGTGTVGQGNNGGNATANPDIAAGGGGGYAEAGIGASTNAGGNGGQGYLLPSELTSLSAFSGMTRVGSGGGGGCRGSLSGPAGVGGAGAGNGSKGYVIPGDATSFGSGGGGPAQSSGSQPWYASGNGKAGVVVIKSSSLASSTLGSPSTTSLGGFNYYVFTSSGSITF